MQEKPSELNVSWWVTTGALGGLAGLMLALAQNYMMLAIALYPPLVMLFGTLFCLLGAALLLWRIKTLNWPSKNGVPLLACLTILTGTGALFLSSEWFFVFNFWMNLLV
jgi:hypothetical protein